MSKTVDHLLSASKKISKFYGRRFVGYLTPSEIVAVCEDIKFGYRASDLENARFDKENGAGNPSWFYFQLQEGHGPKLRRLLGRKLLAKGH